MELFGLLLGGLLGILCLFRARTCAAAHPVFPPDIAPGEIEHLKTALAPLLEMPEEDLIARVPDRTGFRFVGCPNCEEGTQEGQLTWSIEDPDRVRCRYCGMGFPNEQYPESGVQTFTTPTGKTVEYPFWETPTGYRYFFSAKAWREARVYLAGRAQALGILYHTTRDPRCARRAALILNAFARYYPGFLVSQDLPHRPKDFALEPPYPTAGGKWGRWRYDEIPTDCVLAYDAIYESGELERLSDELGADVKSHIETDFFRGAIRQDGFHGPNYTNASPRIYEGYAVTGRVLEDPVLVHEAVRRSRRLLERRFFVDGFWYEGSISYHRMTLAGMRRVFDALKSYTDPPGYAHPETGARFENLDLEQDLPIVRRAARIPDRCRYPDGRIFTVHDNWARFEDARPPEQPGSTLLTGAGHAWLEAGEDAGRTQVHLHFSGGYGHEHADNLNLILFAKGEELLPDLGYTHTRYRAWSTATLSHNTVLIDEHRQYTRGNRGRSDGQIRAFETAAGPVQWMEAEAVHAYPGLALAYRRTVFLIRAGEESYVVDLFRIAGGSQHDWALHGSADRDTSAQVDPPATPYAPHLLPDVAVRYPESESDRGEAEGRNPDYAFFQNVSRSTIASGACLNFSGHNPEAGVRTHLPGLQGAELFLGDAPSLRRAEENDALLDRFRMPIALLRRTGPPPLESCFAAVHEPYRDTPFIHEVSLIPPEENKDAVILRVRHPGGTDYILHRAHEGRGGTGAGPLFLQGEAGFAREQDGAIHAMGLWGGTELRWKDTVLSGSGNHECRVRGILRTEEGAPYNALRTSHRLPGGHILKGATAIVAFGDRSTAGHRVEAVERHGAETHIVLAEDPGIAITETGIRHLFFPLLEIPGPVICKIRTSAFASPSGLTSVGAAQFSPA